MLNKLRSKLARWLAPAPEAAPAAPVPPVTDNGRKGMGISAAALGMLGGVAAAATIAASPGAFRQYKTPDLPPGVIPTKFVPYTPNSGITLAQDEAPRMALDDGGTTAPSYAWLNGFNTFGCGLGFLGYPYLAELTQVSEYRSPSETTSTEMTRKWIRLVGKGKGDKQDKLDAIEARMTELGVRDKFRRASLQDGLFGRSQIIMNFKDQTDDLTRQLPVMIDPAGIKKGSLLSLQVVEPYWSTPYSWNSTHPERADFYIPQSWYIMGRKTHATRLLTFVGREVPDLLKPAYNFGGISLTQLMEPYVNMWLRTRRSVNNLINAFSITALSTDLSATLQDGDDGSAMVKRANLFTRARDNLGLTLLNKDEEEIVQVNTPLGTLDKLQAQSQEHMAAPAHIPLIKLFGVVPTGLNATGEGEIQVWYDFVRAFQENLFGPQLDILMKVIQLDLFGAIDDDIGYEWVSLDEPTAKEAAEIRTANAAAATAYVAMGAVSNEEVRENLQGDPESGYDNLDGPAPEPPDEDGGEDMDPDTSEADAANNDADREHASGEADKDRKHESKENDKDRAHELKIASKKKVTGDAAFAEGEHPRDAEGKFAAAAVGRTELSPLDKKRGHELVEVHTHKVEKAFAGLPDFHIGENASGGNAIGNRYERAKTFMRGSGTVHASTAGAVTSGPKGEAVMQFIDGRHRFAALRDMGAKTVKLSAAPETAAQMQKLGWTVT